MIRANNVVPATQYSLMKAVICTKYGPPEVLELGEVDKPIPKDGEICIKVKATSVSAADYRIRSFTVPLSFWLPARIALGITKPRKPILGIELAGEIESVGKDVRKFEVGDEVYAATLQNFGAYAEYICISEDGPVAVKPSNISFEEAAAIPISARTALCHFKKANIQKGQKVLIYGASGSVGTYAVQLSKYFEADVTAICSGDNIKMVKALGADKVIDYTDSNFIKQLETYDIVFLAVDKWSFSLAKRVLNENGTYINVTTPMKSPAMLWTTMTSGKKVFTGQSSPETAEALIFLKNLVEKGVIKPIIDRSYPIHDIVEAHRYVDKGHKKGNVVISI